MNFGHSSAQEHIPSPRPHQNHKLLSHETLNILLILSFGIGVLFLFFTYIKQRGKAGGHSFLPRPDQVEAFNNQMKSAARKPKQHVQLAAQSDGYV